MTKQISKILKLTTLICSLSTVTFAADVTDHSYYKRSNMQETQTIKENCDYLCLTAEEDTKLSLPWVAVPFFYGFSIAKPILAGLSSLSPQHALASAAVNGISLAFPPLATYLSARMSGAGRTGGYGDCCSFITLAGTMARSIFVFSLTTAATGVAAAYIYNPNPAFVGANIALTSIAAFCDVLGNSVMYCQWYNCEEKYTKIKEWKREKWDKKHPNSGEQTLLMGRTK